LIRIDCTADEGGFVPVVRTEEIVGDQKVPVLIEVDEVPRSTDLDEIYGPHRGEKAEKVLNAAGGLFNDGLRLARSCAVEAVQAMDEAAEAAKPQELQIQLAIKLDAEVGAVLAKSSAGAQLQVTMTWRRD
jgi:hypothetical protein